MERLQIGNNKLDELEDILKARLVLNSILARKHRYHILNRSNRRRRFQLKQSCLRISFTSLILVSFLLGTLIFFPISKVFINFNYQCPLYTSIVSFKLIESYVETNETRILVETNDILWGPISVCIYSITTGILAFIYSIISLFFFIMFNIKEMIENDYFLLWPWMVLSSIVTLFVLVSSCLITNGFAIFCSNLNNLNKSCRDFQYIDWKKFNSHFFYDYLLISVISSWLLFTIMLFIVMGIFFRILIIYRHYENEILDLEKEIKVHAIN